MTKENFLNLSGELETTMFIIYSLLKNAYLK